MADSKRKAGSNNNASESKTTQQTKRQRVSRACDQCRTAREKCDGIQPSCFTCASQNRNCSYTVSPKKRGIPPGYIKSLEVALAWTFANVPGSEEALLTTLNGTGQGLVTGRDTDGVNRLHKRWRKSTVCKEIDKLLTGSDDHTLSTADPASPDSANDDHHHLGSTSDHALLTPSSIVAAEKPLSSHSYTGSMDPGIDRSPTPKPSDQRLLSLSPKTTLPSNIWQLVDIYYAYTHCWLPIIEKQDILKVAYSYPDDGLRIPQHGSGSGKHAELWSVLALASFQAQADEVEGRETFDNTSRNNLDTNPNRLYDQAQSYIPSRSGAHEPGHVTALLLLALVDLGRQNFPSAWLLIGYAVRIMCLLSRQLQTQGEKPSRDKRISLACFILDTLLSAHLGLQPHLNRFHQEGLGPVNEDGLDEWHAWVGYLGSSSGAEGKSRSPIHALSIFNRLATLASILNEAISMTHPHENARSMPELQQWINSLPESCSFAYSERRKPKASPTPPLLHLRMAYEYVNMVCSPLNIPTGSSINPTSTIPAAVQDYVRAFGSAALPPIAGLYMATPCSYQDIDRAATISAALRHTWGTADSGIDRDVSVSPTHQADRYRHQRIPQMPRSDRHDDRKRSTNVDEAQRMDSLSDEVVPSLSGLPPAVTASSAMHPPFRSSMSSLASNNPINDPLKQASPIRSSVRSFPTVSGLSSDPTGLSINTGNLATIYDPANPLDSYSGTANTTDIDALFDELASLDNAEGVAHQPQFMQNLGFAPDVDVNDVLASDYGQFDPFSVYMQQGVFEAPADQG